MSFREVLRFELEHHLRRPATWLFLAVLLGLSLLRADSTDVGLVHYHAPVQAAGSSLLVGLLATLVTAGLFVEAGHRDLRWRMDPLFYAAPLRRWDYLGGRFLGALLVNALLLLAVPAGLLLGTLLPTVSAETLGPLRPEAYLLPYLLFLLPNLLVNAAVLFGITVLSGRSLPAYLGALGLTAVYLFTGLTVDPGGSGVVPLLDPMGGVALTALTEGWTRAEQNARLVGPEGLLLWNRLLWVALAAGMLAFTLRRFRFAHGGAGARRRRARRLDPAPAVAPGAAGRGGAVAVPPAPRSFGVRARTRQVLAVARLGLRQTVLSRDFLLVAVGLAVFALLMLLDGPISGMPVWPLTPDVAAELTGRVVELLVTLLTAFYAGELVWGERDARIEKIGDSLPVPDWVPFAGKLLALGGVLAGLQAVLMASGMTAQALQGHYDFQPGLYLQLLFGLQLPGYLLFAVLALLVHVLVDQKYAGHLAAVLLFVGILQARRLGIEHNLLVYGSDPGWVYSELNGLGSAVVPFVSFKLYWAAWALLLGAVALLFQVRGTEDGVRARLRLARRRFTPRAAAGAAAALVLVLSTGGFVFYNTNVLNDYRTTREAEALAAGYERRYKRFEHAPQPRLTGVALNAELYPERREATLGVAYRLVNRTGEPIDSVHLFSAPDPEVTLRRFRFDRPARPVLEDGVHGYRIYALDRPLQPGDSLRVSFELTVAPRGFRNREQASRDGAMAGRYTSLGSWLLPAIGYQRGPELSSPRARGEHGLPPGEIRPSIHDPAARQLPRVAPWSDRIDLEATVGTALDQTVVLPGTLRREWTEGRRRYFHYRTDTPILNFFSLLSARFAVAEARWNDVEIRVLHHPDHGFNVERVIGAVQASLDYYSEELGPYPYRQLRMVEFPRYGSGARAYAGQIIYSERHPITLARLDGRPDRRDDPLEITAHEVGHQWWGQQVMGADVQGSQMLSETLAQYGAAMVVERTHGAEQARRLVRSMHLSYLNGRGKHTTPEAPLLLTTDHGYIHYGKGGVVMYALKDYLGEERVNTALRRLVRKHGMRGPPYPTTLDLYRELEAVAPDSLRYLLEDLVATITLWDLQATGARAEPAGGGEYRVTLEVQAAKLRSDSIGNDTAVPMNDLVEVGVFAEDGELLYLRKHRVRSGRQAITVTVPGRPARAGIDPHHKLIARHADALYTTDARTVEVKLGGRSGSGPSSPATHFNPGAR